MWIFLRDLQILFVSSILINISISFTGAAYLDLPATILKQNVDSEKVAQVMPVPSPSLVFPDVKLVDEAADLIARAKKPLVIVGKGTLFSKKKKKIFF